MPPWTECPDCQRRVPRRVGTDLERSYEPPVMHANKDNLPCKPLLYYGDDGWRWDNLYEGLDLGE